MPTGDLGSFLPHLPGVVRQVTLQMLLLGLPRGCHCGRLGQSLGAPAGTARTWFADSPRRIEMLSATGGLAMIGVGVSWPPTGRRD
jgi:hypothetical protein